MEGRKHSPLEWKVDPNDTRNIRTQKGELVAACTVSDSQPEANARFIVNSCNQYYEMLAVIKGLEETFGPGVDRYKNYDGEGGHGAGWGEIDFIDRARAIIKAEAR